MKLQQFLKSNAIAIVAAITIGTTMSFKLAGSPEGQDFYYDNESLSEGAFQNANNWTTQNKSTECVIKGERPCKITVPEGSSLERIIGSKSNIQVLEISKGRKP
ncbi:MULTISPECIES: hypothetical protein [Elizabethkingia]|uniref:Uncharacterized protein n=2 Tax=Elizabethkingia TaxID=308865 RepID=A0A494J8T8_9FLAO|nr:MULTISPECIES: hypothetical protein [Elizabethkingia]AQX10254.1 hypothetical protein BBD34_17155 [Elizabethkingia ursingii]AQX51323.1 hypothetical protein AYC66_11820 [Elizabethkingia anophelis]MCT4196691.1 hypothetical protein [Elizabethkingia anophelis]MCT4225365.1 hypothetical protein [Elizabethkingia anophelis]MCT4306956.1 hypothetical protein [Elizabethkingia anophelis]